MPQQTLLRVSRAETARSCRIGGSVGVVYKVVELSTVGEEEIEQTLNEWTSEGWTFEHMQFAMREASKRPAMAFLAFTRNDDEDQGNP